MDFHGFFQMAGAVVASAAEQTQARVAESMPAIEGAVNFAAEKSKEFAADKVPMIQGAMTFAAEQTQAFVAENASKVEGAVNFVAEKSKEYTADKMPMIHGAVAFAADQTQAFVAESTPKVEGAVNFAAEKSKEFAADKMPMVQGAVTFASEQTQTFVTETTPKVEGAIGVAAEKSREFFTESVPRAVNDGVQLAADSPIACGVACGVVGGVDMSSIATGPTLNAVGFGAGGVAAGRLSALCPCLLPLSLALRIHADTRRLHGGRHTERNRQCCGRVVVCYDAERWCRGGCRCSLVLDRAGRRRCCRCRCGRACRYGQGQGYEK